MRKVYSLNQDWLFDSVEINLPHSWNAAGNVERGLHIYEKTLIVHKRHRREQLFLEFLGANSVCRVFLNNTLIGEHRGGYSTFRFNITAFYDWNTQNRLTVEVDNSPTQDVSPLNGDFTIYGGLYRSVNLICVPESHFDLMFYGSEGIIIQSEVDEKDVGTVRIKSHVVNGLGLEIRYAVKDENSKEICISTVSALHSTHEVSVDNCNRWGGKVRPYLYTLAAELRSGDEILDEVMLSFGFRNCEMHSEKGFLLNGQPLRINGVAKHQDFDEIGNAITKEHLDLDFELMSEIGANALRLSHYQHNRETYDYCDEYGLITWAEIPMMALPDKEAVLLNAKQQLCELVYQNCHHPSICFWGIQNEIAMGGESLAMYAAVNELNDLIHTIHPNCISASANMYYVKNDSSLNFITDLLGYNLYYGWYYGETEDLEGWIEQFHKENPNVALGLSEYGADCNLNFHSTKPKVKDYSEEFQSLYHEKTYAIIESKPYLWGSFVWNMFDFGSFVRDEGGTKGKNTKGLITFDRKTKKDAFFFYKAKWSNLPFIHICEKRFINRIEDRMTLKVYSNLDSVTLFVEGVMFEIKTGKTVFAFENVPLKLGENRMMVIGSDGQTEFVDEHVFIRRVNKDDSYEYIDPNPGLKVENWFTQQKGELDFFPEGYYSIKDRICELMECEEAWSVISKKAPKIVERSTPGSPVTLLWVFNKMRALFSEELIMKINSELIKIKKI